MMGVKSYIEKISKHYAPEDIFCFFDIDETILEPTEPAAQAFNIAKHRNTFLELKLKYSDFTPSVHGYCMLLGDHKILDDNVFDVIDFLNRKKIQNLAFTATPNTLLEGHDLKQVRFQQLVENNVNFENNFYEKELIIDSLTLPKGHPILYRGMIFSNGNDICNNKGIVLHEFLKRLNHTPKCIIFLDDNLINIVDINQTLALKNPDIDFFGVYFTGSHDVQSKEVSKEEFSEVWDDYFLRESKCYQKLTRKILNY